MKKQHIKQYITESSKPKADRIYSGKLYPAFDKLITGVIKEQVLNFQTYELEDYRAEAHAHLFKVISELRDGQGNLDLNRNFSAYLFECVKRKLRHLSKKDRNKYIPNGEMGKWVIDTGSEPKEYKAEDFLSEFLHYLRRNKKVIYKRQDKQVILQTYINKLSNSIYDAGSVGDLTENIEKELTQSFNREAVKQVKYKLNHIYSKAKKYYLENGQLPDGKRWG